MAGSETADDRAIAGAGAADGGSALPGAAGGDAEEAAGRGEQELNANGRVLSPHWKRAVSVIWTGQAASVLATYAATFAAMWFITETTGSALYLALGGIASLLPTALLSPLGGVAADRLNRKRLMIVADGTAGLFSLALAAVVALDQVSVPLLLALLTVRSCAQAFHGTALMALAPELVPARHMVRINTLDQMLTSASGIIGPILGIALFAAFGFQSVLLLDAACAAVACLCLGVANIPNARGGAASSGSAFADLREGLDCIREDRGLARLMVLVMAAMVVFMPTGTLYPLMTYGWVGGDGFQASLVEAATGIGLLAGSMLLFAWGGGTRLVRVMGAAGLVMGGCSIACGLLPATAFPAFAVLASVTFAAMGVFNGPIAPLIQKRVPADRYGRVVGLFLTGSTLATPVGLLVAGIGAQALGVTTWFVISGGMLAAIMAVALRSPSVRALDDAGEDENERDA